MSAITEAGTVARRTLKSQEYFNESLEVDSSGVREGSKAEVGCAQGFELRVDPDFWKDHNVQVIIRLRPLNSSEISLQGQNRCVLQDSCQTLSWIGHPESRFTFDLIADEYVSQERLFKVAGVPMVENCMAGYNSCMFAYGQTGSGKTHTMLGDIEGGIQRNSANCGMTPRVFEYLFSRIEKEKETQSNQKLHFTCKCSFLEIYNEQILDLLDPSSINLQIREDARRGVYVENLKEYEVSSPRDVIQQLIQGAANRKVAATNMNHASSRSHSVFTCIIERKWESQGVSRHRFARLNLVDLAGSERQKSSGAEGDRLKEATNINKSLSTLGLVIMNLVSSSGKRQPHIPYRDSKLTFLLQDSLGGNSKTMIIANISPSNCCALETLSTLKFAQRAKFIRNNAVVNEEASGDVLTLRLQIQRLKKEVNHLRGLISGGPDKLGSDGTTASSQDSPGLLKLNGDQASFSPLTFDKRLSPRKEHEAALVATLRRIHDKEEELKALAAEREAADRLIIHRTEEVRNLKLRLRFREDAIRRLEALASAKLSPDTHISQEKEALLKELEVLRNQVDRNSEVTRFAMENMQLREELRRLKSFVEDGEREMMNEQITVLQDKLLEALDWKLMHEKNSEDQPLFSWDSSVNEENEFLHLEAIQNQREAEALRKNLTVCLEAKENLERRVDELISQLEAQKNVKNSNKESGVVCNDQMELKTMVDAIAAASQREAEAHETAITLARENDELHMKLKALIEDNNKLIELYESASVKAATTEIGDGYPVGNTREMQNNLVDFHGGLLQNCVDFHEDQLEDKKVDNLEHQLNEILEENEKLMGLYEKAMQERDNFKRMLASYEIARIEVRDEINCPEKLVEVDKVRTDLKQNGGEFIGEHAGHEFSEEMLSLVRIKLDQTEVNLAPSGKVINFSCLLEKIAKKVLAVYSRFNDLNQNVVLKQQEITALGLSLPKLEERQTVMGNKLLALQADLQSSSSMFDYWEERDINGKVRYESCLASLEQKKEELRRLCTLKHEMDTSCTKVKQSEVELRSNIDHLKMQLKVADAQRKESERVLLSIDNLNRSNHSESRTLNIGKATDLLKSEEERTKIAFEIKKLREKLVSANKEMAKLRSISESLDSNIEKGEADITSESVLLQEAELSWQRVAGEKKMLCKMIEDGMVELGRILVEYQQCLFEVDLKKGEILLYEDELILEMKEMEDVKRALQVAVENLRNLLEDKKGSSYMIDPDDCSRFASENVENQFRLALRSLAEVKLLLFGDRDK
ncbi:kinesin-like protein KIN-12G [Dendrobium catenatum]|uniref:kinesin-like protein KIN-12G n=1 Tax=Dendrobium catenatum TaxID=906689 RepID=UPI0009F1CECE|nr:kinesin-like protein KIN-12G [Dendrobium catenatum]